MFHSYNFRKLFEKFVGNRFFTVKFVKKNGLDRVMTCRLHVNKHSKGGEQSADPGKYIVGWEPATNQYRNISIETLQWVKCRGAVVNLMADQDMHITKEGHSVAA